jgi:hypothetical protein
MSRHVTSASAVGQRLPLYRQRAAISTQAETR